MTEREMPPASMLEKLAHDKRSQWESLLRERRRIEVLIQRCREYLESLNKLLTLEGLSPIPLASEGDRPKGFAAIGNKSPKMPLRRAEFERQSLSDAIQYILETSPKPLHADVIAERIYEIKGPQDLRNAKHTLVSTLVSGMKTRGWERVAPNTFASSQYPPSLFDNSHDGKGGTEQPTKQPLLSTAQ